MTQNHNPNVHIARVLREIKADYSIAVETARKLKRKMNSLEQRTSQENQNLSSLRIVMKQLDELTDSLILKSKKAWEEYRELESNCKMQGSILPQLDELYANCKKTEQLAADLLCFLLGHPEQTKSDG